MVGSQLVGLVPLKALLDAAAFYCEKENLFILEEEHRIRLVGCAPEGGQGEADGPVGAPSELQVPRSRFGCWRCPHKVLQPCPWGQDSFLCFIVCA